MADDTKITVKEFRMWLQGVEEMQDPAWVPNPTQWARIREKINTITEEQEAVHAAPVQQYQQPVIPPSVNYPVPPTGVPLGNDVPGIPAGPSSFQQRPWVPPAPPAGGLFATPESPNMPVRTPNIDTTDGTYQSSFA